LQLVSLTLMRVPRTRRAPSSLKVGRFGSGSSGLDDLHLIPAEVEHRHNFFLNTGKTEYCKTGHVARSAIQSDAIAPQPILHYLHFGIGPACRGKPSRTAIPQSARTRDRDCKFVT
jgi:hypothetical protein